MDKTDLQLKKDIELELRWDPDVNEPHIGVRVDNGMVSLYGTVDTDAETRAAKEAAERISGVRMVVQNLRVKIVTYHVRSDSDIAESIQKTFVSNVCIPSTVSAKVEQGSVTLEGQADWTFEREAAERAVHHLAGVRVVRNYIALKSEFSGAQVKESVLAALQRQPTEEPWSIQVDTQGTQVTLSGYASTWQAIGDASTAAWAAPWVTQVFDHVEFSPCTQSIDDVNRPRHCRVDRAAVK